MARSYFMQERWEEKARAEHAELTAQEERQEADISLYLDIKREAGHGGEALEKILRAVEEKAVRYRITVNLWGKARRGSVSEGSVDEFERLEQNRTLSHNALIDEVNLLSRQFREAGLDNEWRRTIGEGRDDVGRWALAVAQLIYRKFEDSHREY